MHRIVRKEFRVASAENSHGALEAIGAVVLVLIAVAIGFQFRGRSGAGGRDGASTVNIAGIAYPFQGRQAYNGLTGVVINRAGSRTSWPGAGSRWSSRRCRPPSAAR